MTQLTYVSIADNSQTYERLQARLASRVTYDLDYRIYNLKQLAFLIKDNREAIAEALKRDLDKGPASVDLEEVRPSLAGLQR